MTANHQGLRVLLWVKHRGFVLGAPSLSVTLWTEYLITLQGHWPANRGSVSLCCYCRMWKPGISVCALCIYVCERQREPGSGSNLEPPFLWHLWQMARPFEEQSTAIDIKLPALKTEGPAQPHLFTVSPGAAWTACPVTNAALVPCSFTTWANVCQLSQ